MENGHPRGFLGKSSKYKNKSYDEIYGHFKSLKIKEKISKRLTGRQYSYKSEKSKLANQNRARQKILERYEAGWMPKAGRCKKITYNSEIAGQVKLDGSWEHVVAMWFDVTNTNWRRNIKRFQYTNLEGKQAHYTPDFIINENTTLEYYVEVKGYETEKDVCKWSQFSHPLKIFKRKEITQFKKDLEAYSSGL